MTAGETHRANIDDLLAALTHVCRKNALLKLRPDHCKKRKARRQRIARGRDYAVHAECRDCPGPVEIGS